MPKFAEHTTVPVEKSKVEIEKLLVRYGAEEFVSGWTGTTAQILFVMKGKRIKFVLHLPMESEYKNVARYEQANRQRWRALLLCIKAKFESVASAITTFEEEFLPHFVIPGDGRTLGEIMIPQLQKSYHSQKALPPLLSQQIVDYARDNRAVV